MLVIKLHTAICYGPSNASMPVTKTRPVGTTGASWHNKTSWIIGRGVAESCDCNLVHKYVSTRVHYVLAY